MTEMKNTLPFDLVIQDLEVCMVGDPYEIRTRVTAVKGRCLNRLTKGPYRQRYANYIKLRNCCFGSGGQIRTNDLPGMNRPL